MIKDRPYSSAIYADWVQHIPLGRRFPLHDIIHIIPHGGFGVSTIGAGFIRHVVLTILAKSRELNRVGRICFF